jgi:uncharacterized protein YcbK (DUF882 family)
MTTEQKEFQSMLDAAGVRYFSARELFFRGASDTRLRLNTDPPRSVWRNLVAVAVVADKVREAYGGPLRVVSAYRSVAYNRAIRGAANSTHTRGQALDLACPQPERLYHALLALRRAGEFRGGLGLYSTFVHVDVRGTNTTWRG